MTVDCVQPSRDAVLAAVAYAADRFLRSSDWEHEIQGVLAQLGEATAVSRVYLFRVHSDNSAPIATQLYEWVSDGVTPEIDNPELQAVDMLALGYRRWVEKLPRGEIIYGRIDEIPASEREFLEAQDITSIAIVPITVESAWWGFIGFDDTVRDRDWHAVELDALLAAAKVLGASIQHREATRRLRENERRLAEAYRRELEISARLQRLDELKDAFVTAVSHELRTPLTAIDGFVATLVNHDESLSPQRRRELLDRLNVNVGRLDQLLGELLDLNHLKNGRLQPDFARCTVGDVITRALDDGPDLNGRRVSVDVSLPHANLDAVLVRRILQNLLRNVERHTPADSTVWITAQAHEEGMHLIVADNGPGIPDQLHESMFIPFEHGPTTPQHSPGVGVRLSLVSQFAALHGGRAWIETRNGGGTAVHVVLAGGEPARSSSS